jgi:hypothetical protein
MGATLAIPAISPNLLQRVDFAAWMKFTAARARLRGWYSLVVPP